jgi:hypothetical protein
MWERRGVTIKENLEAEPKREELCCSYVGEERGDYKREFRG